MYNFRTLFLLIPNLKFDFELLYTPVSYSHHHLAMSDTHSQASKDAENASSVDQDEIQLVKTGSGTDTVKAN